MDYLLYNRLGFEQEIPDHSFSNRHGRFRDSGIFLGVFEEIVRRCPEAGLGEGKRLTVDGTVRPPHGKLSPKGYLVVGRVSGSLPGPAARPLHFVDF